MPHSVIDTIWYKDFRAQNNWRYRLQCHAPISLELVGFPPVPTYTGGPLPSGIVPGWDDSSNPDTAPDPETSIYERLPSDVVVSVVGGRCDYDGPAIGFPLTPDLKVRFDLHRLATGNAYLVGLKDFLLNPIGTAGGQLDLGDSTTATFDTSVVYTLLCDEGDAGREIDDFLVVFQGAQRKNPTRPLSVSKRQRICEYEVTVSHIVRLCLESIPASAIAKRFFEEWNDPTQMSHWRPSTGERASRFQYDDLFESDGVAYARVHGEITGEEIGFKGRWYAVDDLWHTIELLAINALSSFMRAASLTARPLLIRVAGGTYSPYGLLTFHELDYTPENGRGPALSSGALSFCGYVWPGSIDGLDMVAGTYDTRIANDQLIGGFLVDHGPNSIFAYKNAWDFIKAGTDGLPVKAQILQTSDTDIQIRFLAVFDNSGGAHNLRYQDIETESSDTEVEPILGEGMVTGATVAVPGVTGEDANQIDVKLYGVRQEQTRPIEMMFHNHPIIDDTANVVRIHTSRSSWLGYNPDIDSASVVGALSAGFNARTLCYFATPPLIKVDTEVPIRVHDHISIDLGRGTPTIDGAEVARPAAVFSSIVNQETFEAAWWNPMKQAMYAAQQSACMAYAIGYRLATLLGSERQTAYDVTLPVEQALPNDMGEVFTFVDGLGAYAGANIFLDDGFSYLSDLPGEPHLVSLETDYIVGRSKARLMGIPE